MLQGLTLDVRLRRLGVVEMSFSACQAFAGCGDADAVIICVEKDEFYEFGWQVC